MTTGRAEVKVTDEFLAEQGHTRESYERLSKSGKWSVRNRAQQYKSSRACIAKKPEYYSKKRRERQLKSVYNISQEQFDGILKEQKGCCAICGTNKPTGKWKAFAVDHNHKTNQIRGLLCNECNRGMGLLKDDPILLIKAAQYLLRHARKTKVDNSNTKSNGKN